MMPNVMRWRNGRQPCGRAAQADRQAGMPGVGARAAIRAGKVSPAPTRGYCADSVLAM